MMTATTCIRRGYDTPFHTYPAWTRLCEVMQIKEGEDIEPLVLEHGSELM